MKLYYVKVKNWDNLSNGDTILFNLPNQQIVYKIAVSDGVFCDHSTTCNSKIFGYLNLNAKDFVQNIVGYPCEGGWPEVKSINDLKKVIKALDDECVKKFEKPNTPKFKVGDKVRILPREGDPKDYIGVYVDAMLQFVGKIATIRKIYSDSSIYLVNNNWTWDPKALELIDKKEEPETMDINQAKDGDYVSITRNTGTKCIILFRNIEDAYVTRYANYSLSNNKLYFNSSKIYGYWGLLEDIEKVNYATEEEKQLLDSKLLEEGYRWNNSTKKLEAIDSPNTSINIDKPETQFEAELNLFPTKKHYQLNFDY